MLKCKEVAKILSSDMDPKSRSLGVRWHLLICDPCRRYVRHLQMIRQAFKNLLRPTESTEKLTEKIISQIPHS